MIAHIVWMDDGVCEVMCECGETVTIGEQPKVCDDCGRRYSLTQFVHVEQPLGRCAYCNIFIYGTQKKRKRYCSEDCGVRARRDRKILAEVAS
jgi:hypothetical protein